MKLIRIIPSLLINENYLVKGKNFENHRYIGDIYNAVKIYSEKKAHELILLDIFATKNKSKINIDLIKKIRDEIFIPLCVGGGIKNIKDVSDLIESGVEKVSLNSILDENINLISEISNKYGSQSVLVSLDIYNKKDEIILIQNNKKKTFKLLEFKNYLKILENAGAGEILITRIDNEGTQNGFDIEFFKKLNNLISIPIIANGGAKNLADFENLFDKTEICAAVGGACFVYYGARKAVLINYPKENDLEILMSKYENA